MRCVKGMFVACCLGLLMVLVFNCSGEDAEEIADTLANRLTDALNFDGGSVKEGEPPSGTAGSEAPQVSNVNNLDLRLGAGFSFSLESDYGETGEVAKAIVFVKGATNYIEVDAELVDGQTQLSGTLEDESDLSGEDFDLEFALQTSDGVTGEYTSMSVQVTEEQGSSIDTDGDELRDSNVDGGDAAFEPEGTDTDCRENGCPDDGTTCNMENGRCEASIAEAE